MNQYLPKIIFIILYSNLSFAEVLLNQDVDIASGSTLSNDSGGTIRELSGGPYTIDNRGTIEATDMNSNNHNIRLLVGTSVDNSGLIDTSGSANLSSIIFTDNSGTNSVINSGTIQAETTGQYGHGIVVLDASLTEITNSSGGTIKVTDSAYVSGAIRISERIGDGGSVNTITNNGTITAIGTTHSRGIISIDTGTIDRINNTGTIQAQGGSETNYGIVFWNDSGTTVTNSGTIQGTGGTTSRGIHINGNISSITNTGTILGGKDGIGNDGHITTIVNTGTITGTTGYGINNGAGSITNLTNSQNNLTYNGKLPTNYYVKVNSSSSYGKITISNPQGSMNVGISDDSTLEATTYSSVFSGITDASTSFGGVTSGTVINGGKEYSWSLVNSVATSWDLTLTFLRNAPSAADTQRSIRAIKGQLQGNLNSLTAGANFANMNTYDCNFFDAKGGCFSFGNRYTDVQSPSIQTNSFVATGGYKLSDHFRVAGFIDQNLNYNLAHNIDVENKGPLVGLIGVWNQHANQLGWQIKVANAYQSKDASIKRSVTGTSEAGKGKTDIDAQSYVAELSYNHAINSSLFLRPYMALRYALVKQDGYTETGVDNPLTYNTIRDRSKTALVGVKVKKQLTNKVVARGSVGLEHDLSHKTDNLEASGVSGLTSESFSNRLDKTRPVASLGADYYIDQTQRLSVNAFHQELPFASTKSRTLYINYMLGF
tara:strand:+ start:10101 stop:12242 length:2142 start_codon:yes stop_codon:yes gene_type:complete